jgi:hypothetical protein
MMNAAPHPRERRWSQTPSYVKERYLLKPAQVPINELLKLKLMYDKRQSVITEKEHVSKLRYMDLTTKLNVNNLDNRMLILDRRIDHDQSQEGGNYKR